MAVNMFVHYNIRHGNEEMHAASLHPSVHQCS